MASNITSSPSEKKSMTISTHTAADVVLELTFFDVAEESDLHSSLDEKYPTLKLKSEDSGASKGVGSEDPKLLRQLKQQKAVRLSNNLIRNMSIIIAPLQPILTFDNIRWLDLSFNQITGVSDAILTAFPNLSTLYLHANKISKLSDVKKLSTLTSLRTLSLYGNPIEEKKHYKKYVIYHVNQLTQFDSSPITAADRSQVSGL